MPRGSPSPAVWVQLAQAMVARELVDSVGLPERRAADLLGLTPSAVSQYRSGHRRGGALATLADDERSRNVARNAAQQLGALPGPSADSLQILLDTARGLAEVAGLPGRRTRPLGAGRPGGVTSRELSRELHHRIQIEQSAVTECMRLAQKSRDELTRSVFRQIAADSLRHAEIVASIQTYLERGLDRSMASGVAREDIVRLITREREAEAKGAIDVGAQFGGIMSVLWESMEADERKHEALLDRMLSTGFPEERRTSSIRTRRPPPSGSGDPKSSA
jgi:rubrerythrin/DNA-binding transcriptional regulator YdaS (Cro superfamily)